MNHFDFFEIAISFDIDPAVLKKKYLINSKKYHPDYHTDLDTKAYTAIVQKSAQNNEAYKILKDPDLRMKYILDIKGVLGKEGENSMSQEFLMDMMDINERIMELQFDFDQASFDASKKEIGTFEAALETDIQTHISSYESEPKTEILTEIKDYYLKKKYLKRLKEHLARVSPEEA